MARILGRILSEEHIKFLYYFGSLTSKQKAAAIEAFHEEDDIIVLVRIINGLPGQNMADPF